MSTWLVTGGAGYIGAHVVRAMVADGASVVVLDDLSTSDGTRVDPGAVLVEGSVRDRGLVRRVLREHAVTGVVHIAAKKQVGESMADPLLYYRENVEGLVALLDGCRDKGVDAFVFSSSAATYGLPDVDLVTEDTPGVPLSPYGESKLIGEWLLRDCERAYGMRAMNLRYFNVAGCATPELGDTGVFNLVPMVFERLEAGERPRVFGGDYPTPTARACATTSTSRTSPTRTWPRCGRSSGATPAPPTTSAAGRARACSTCCAWSVRSPAGTPRPTSSTAAPATPRASSPRSTGSARAWASPPSTTCTPWSTAPGPAGAASTAEPPRQRSAPLLRVERGALAVRCCVRRWGACRGSRRSSCATGACGLAWPWFLLVTALDSSASRVAQQRA
jgi:dTDP-4-dehydrorhamnose reductase